MVQKNFRLGGVDGERSRERVEDTLIQIDGVKKATLDVASKQLTLDYDPNIVHQDHLTSTLNSLGYSILGDREGRA